MISPSQPPFHPRRDVRPRDAECLKQGRGGARAWLLKSKALTYECTDCGRQASVTAGTIMHASKLPLTIWFWRRF